MKSKAFIILLVVAVAIAAFLATLPFTIGRLFAFGV
jgi:hypothetical protein